MSTMQNTTANEPGWKANPEEYDLVILGGGTEELSLPGLLPGKASVSR